MKWTKKTEKKSKTRAKWLEQLQLLTEKKFRSASYHPSPVCEFSIPPLYISKAKLRLFLYLILI